MWFTVDVVHCDVVHCRCGSLSMWFTVDVVHCRCGSLPMWFTVDVVHCREKKAACSVYLTSERLTFPPAAPGSSLTKKIQIGNDSNDSQQVGTGFTKHVYNDRYIYIIFFIHSFTIIEKSSPCSGGSMFPIKLVQRHITVNKMC